MLLLSGQNNKKTTYPEKISGQRIRISYILKFYSSLYPLSLHTPTKPCTCTACLATTLTYEDLDTNLLIRRISFQKILDLGYYCNTQLSIKFLNHPKESQCVHNRILFLFWTLWMLCIFRLRQIIVLTLYDSILSLDLCNIKVRNLHPIIMLSHILLNLLICSLSTLRFGPRWAKVPWTFSTSLPQSNPSRPYQESHSHGALLNGVWTINTLSRHSFLCPNNFQNQVDLFQLHYKRLGT